MRPPAPPGDLLHPRYVTPRCPASPCAALVSRSSASARGERHARRSAVEADAPEAAIAAERHAATHPKSAPVWGETFQILPYGARTGGGLQAVGRF
jgi:hypothetical protein